MNLSRADLLRSQYTYPIVPTRRDHMDPCPFVRILVGNLAVKFPEAYVPSCSGTVHPSATPCFCKIKLSGHPDVQFATVPFIPQNSATVNSNSNSQCLAACFDLSKTQWEKLVKSIKNVTLKISVYRGRRRRSSTCGIVNTARYLGTILVPIEFERAESTTCIFQNDWVSLSAKQKESAPQLYLTVQTDPDPRFVFLFDGEPECSPQVFQVQGNVKQPVFTCNFTFRNTSNRNLDSRSTVSESSNSRGWFNRANKEKTPKERKGWSITIHDLSGSPVAAASMVTPFVPSPGSQRVSRSNSGAWLILQPGGDGTWSPWGRLEAWRESGSSDSVGFRFEALPATADAMTLANASINAHDGGKFTIDMTTGTTPTNSPHGSFDFGSGSGSGMRSRSCSGSGSGSEFGFGFGFGLPPQWLHRGFVMSAKVDGANKCSRPQVEVGEHHVGCTEDAAAFVALAAAMDLSMDACMLFSRKLRKELRQ